MSMIVCKILFAFYVFISSSNCLNSHILAGIYFTFLENVLNQT